MSTEKNKIQLPALVKELGIAVKTDNFNTVLNQSPPKSWLKVYKGVQYQPIERVKNNLVTIFQDYDWMLKEVKIVANSILVTGTLSVVNPITGRTRNVDGVGAWPIQLKAGSTPMQIENIIQDAIQKNAPAAESLALKSAAGKLGKLFTNGDNEVDFTPIFSTADAVTKEEERLLALIDAAKSIKDLEDLKGHLTNNESITTKFQEKWEQLA